MTDLVPANSPKHYWFLIFSTIGYVDKNGKYFQVPFSFVTFGDSANINRNAYLDMAVFAQKHGVEFLGGEDKVQKITSVEVHSISNLGYMTKEEFEGTCDKPKA